MRFCVHVHHHFFHFRPTCHCLGCCHLDHRNYFRFGGVIRHGQIPILWKESSVRPAKVFLGMELPAKVFPVKAFLGTA